MSHDVIVTTAHSYATRTPTKHEMISSIGNEFCMYVQPSQNLNLTLFGIPMAHSFSLQNL